jgi:hypothetical protein
MSAPDPPARGFVAVACAVALATGAAVALAPGVNVPCDFAAFWSSAVLMAHGQNPYDPVLLLPLERAAGWPLEYAITIFNPPRARRPVLAGCLGALTAVKPHLFVLFALALALDALRCAAGRRAALAGTAVLLGACAAALFVRPEILDDYRTVLLARGTDSHRALGDYAAPVAGVMLRAAVPGKPTVIQFVPCLLAALAFVCAVRKVPPAEHWGAPLPFALAASLVVAPYGGWWYDMVLLLPLVLLVAARTERAPGARRAAVVAFAALNAALVVLYARRADLAPLFALVPPCAAAVAVVLLRAARRHEVPA